MKKYIIAGVAAALLLLTGVILGMKSCKVSLADDAAGYVQADLNLIFQGETQDAERYLHASAADLKKIHENGVAAFVENYLTGGIETETDVSWKYTRLAEELFMTMKYEVGEAKQTDEDTYEVAVKYQPVDVFTNAMPQIAAEAARIEEAAQEGVYEGKDAEIQAMMNLEYLNHAYEYLESAYLEMGYGEREEFTFTVTVGEKNALSMDETEINTFIERILALDKL